MAFDEGTHLDIIKTYSDRISPFWGSSLPDTAYHGALNRDPSYLFNLIMTIPWRLTHQMMALRFVDILLFGLGIIIFRQVLLNSKASKALANVVVALFVLTPVVPFLAAQINYDVLLFVVTGAAILLTQSFLEYLQTNKRIDIQKLVVLVSFCLISSLVKYAFLPIFLGVGIYVGIKLILHVRKTKWKKVRQSAAKDLSKLSRFKMIGLLLLILISLGMFAERYGYNLYAYKTPTPECNQIFSIEQCKLNGPWNRNYQLYQKKLLEGKTTNPNPVMFGGHWLKWITNELFFTLNGSTEDFRTGQPLKLTRIVSVLVLGLGGVLFFLYRKFLIRQYRLGLLLTVSASYLGLLFTQNYLDYLHLGQPVAIQGRYLVPVMMPLYLFSALGYSRFLRSAVITKQMLATLAILFIATQGGSAGIYIIRSDNSWYQKNTTVYSINTTARKVLGALAIGN